MLGNIGKTLFTIRFNSSLASTLLVVASTKTAHYVSQSCEAGPGISLYHVEFYHKCIP